MAHVMLRPSGTQKNEIRLDEETQVFVINAMKNAKLEYETLARLESELKDFHSEIDYIIQNPQTTNIKDRENITEHKLKFETLRQHLLHEKLQNHKLVKHIDALLKQAEKLI